MSVKPGNVYITAQIMNKFGRSEACRESRLLASGREGRGIPRISECLELFEICVQDDPDLKQRLEVAQERKIRYLAEDVERASKHVIKREVDLGVDRKRPRAQDLVDHDLAVLEARLGFLEAAMGPASPPQRGGVTPASSSSASPG